MRYIGIDLALRSTGLCFIDEDGKISVDTVQTFKTSSLIEDINSATTLVTQRVRGFNCKGYKPQIVIESPSMASLGSATRTLARVYGAVLYSLSTHGYKDILEVAPTTLKKFATGSGKASKQEMIDALSPEALLLINRQGTKRAKSDAADAYWLARYGQELPSIK